MVPGSSFIRQGIITAKNKVMQGYRWILGDGESINCIQDPWLVGKDNFKVDQFRAYADSTTVVAQLFLQNAKQWDGNKVVDMFSRDGAALILSTRIPAFPAVDRLAWSKTTNGKYSVKTGYQLWHARNIGTGSVTQSNGWSKLWKLEVPHKIKLFIWRFCRNNVLVRSRLSTKGVYLPLNCPMCNSVIKDLLHVFFACPFALACWHYTGTFCDMSTEDFAPSWLLTKLDLVSSIEALEIARVL